LTADPAAVPAPAAQPGSSRASDLLTLTKPRITSMVVLTSGIGALLAGRGDLPVATVIHALLGTAMVSGGSSAINQIIEIETDARMERTAGRPLPTGRLSHAAAWAFAALLSIAGLVYLAVAVNLLTASLGLAALLSYVALYTPLKKVSSLSTLVGAVPGAIPPMMGWSAVTNSLDPGAWVLFGILFLWQLPHFFAIAWLCKGDYGQAGFPMVPVTDPDGYRTGRQMVFYSLLLLPVSLLTTRLGLTGMTYAVGAGILGVLYMVFSINFLRSPSRAAARRLMRFSILYLPAVLFVMMIDRVV
jgi:protoheme IX farnesyltransferase